MLRALTENTFCVHCVGGMGNMLRHFDALEMPVAWYPSSRFGSPIPCLLTEGSQTTWNAISENVRREGGICHE